LNWRILLTRPEPSSGIPAQVPALRCGAPMLPRVLTGSLLAVVCAIWGLCGTQPVGAAPSPEHQIKAAFMYNFARFVQWPAGAFGQPQAPMILCVLGEDAFGTAFDTIDRKAAQGHELQVRRHIRPEDVRSCHILFVAESERARLGSIFREVSGASILTVSDIDHFAEVGGVIGFYDLDNKVQFSINPEQAHDAMLQINSQLLKLARIVGRSAREDGK